MKIDEFKRFAEVHPHVLFTFVNDGSTDDTFRILKEHFSTGQFSVLNLAHNVGKAEAVRLGVRSNQDCLTVGFLDADLSTPLDQVLELAEYLDVQTRMVFGSRILTLNTEIKRSPKRHYLGRIIATLVSNILGLPIYDTQCGAKVIGRETALKLFEEPFISRWLFDVEIFARMIQIYGRENVASIALEKPLSHWIEAGDSKITFSDMLRIPFHLLRIKIHYKL